MTGEQVRARLIIRGRVQGVFYRQSAATQARAHGLAGWVRNCHDGSVEAVLQGPREAVDAMIRWCGQGPPSASVDRVDTRWEPPEPGVEGFRIAG